MKKKLEFLRKAEARMIARNCATGGTFAVPVFEHDAAVKKVLDQSRKTSSDLVVPAPVGLSYFSFQRAGIEFLASRRGALLADDMGLGKTVEVCGLLNHLPDVRPCLIVCPASMKTVWQRELSRWLCTGARSVSVCYGDKKEGFEGNIVVVNYDILSRFEDMLAKRSWALMVFDEGHYLKNREAQRTQAAKKLALNTARKVILSGTPMLNRPEELWSLLNLLDPLHWPSFYRFAHRYCGPVKTSWGWDFSGASNQRELSLLLRSGLMLRRRKKDVLPELPPVIRQVVPLSVDSSPLLELLTQKLAQLFGFDPRRPPFKIDPEKIPFELISEIRRETRALKVAAAIDFIRDQTSASHQKTVIFAHHLSVLQELHKALRTQSVLVTGETPANARQRAIDNFQNDGEVRYFIASTRAMGLGVTLTASSHVIFVEPDWTPAILEQAEARLARIGQQASGILAQYLVLENSIDEKIFAAVLEKMTVINQVIERQK
jgi:SWI/SNF-related matrix-associated actin-dependent regulator 1 of chromatin subfamily A